MKFPIDSCIQQDARGGIYLTLQRRKTLLSLRQLLQLDIDLYLLPNFNDKTFADFYRGHLGQEEGSSFRWGFAPGDKVIEQYRNCVLIESDGLVQVIEPALTTRVIVDLHESSETGEEPTFYGMTYEQQLKVAHNLVDFTFSGMIKILLDRHS